MTRVLFLCTHNAARSQMAEGLLRHLAGDRFLVFSAGTRPTALHPMAVTAMGEVGIDINGQRSKDVSEYAGSSFDYVITVCDQAQEECPVFPGARRQLHWSLPDPAATEGDETVRVAAFRRVRDDLAGYIRQFISEGEPCPAQP
jgi:arsenate reductase